MFKMVFVLQIKSVEKITQKAIPAKSAYWTGYTERNPLQLKKMNQIVLVDISIFNDY